MIIVAILEVRTDALDRFRVYEKHAARVMQTYGGRIEQTVVIGPEAGVETLKEVHIVRFPDEPAFQAYRTDPGLADVAHLREQSVVATQLLVGRAGPDYHAADA